MTNFVTKTVLLALVLMLSIGQFAAAQVSKEELKSISTPDSVETSLGELNFFDGVPTDDTVTKVYDNLDRMRGVQVFLTARCSAASPSSSASSEKYSLNYLSLNFMTCSVLPGGRTCDALLRPRWILALAFTRSCVRWGVISVRR